MPWADGHPFDNRGHETVKLKRLQHAMYLCRDLEASRKFYTDVLGMEEIPRKLIDPARKGAWFKLGDTRLHLAQWEEGHWSLGGARQPITVWDNHLAFEVDDIEAWKRRLTAMGIEFVVGAMGEGFMKQIYFKDPGGNMVELVQHLRDDWWKEF